MIKSRVTLVIILILILGCHLSKDELKFDNLIIVPERAAFGSKEFDGANKLFKDNLNGHTVKISFGFRLDRETENVAALIEVQAGSLKVFTNNGFITFLPEDKIAIKDNTVRDEEMLFTLTGRNPTLMIFCGEVINKKSGKDRVAAYCRVPSVIESGGAKFIVQRLHVVEQEKLRIVPLTIEFSNDFKGNLVKWIVPMTF